MIQLKVDQKADAAYVRLTEAKIARTNEVNDQVLIDYDEHGNVVGVELLDISDGVDLGRLADELIKLIEPALGEAHIKMLA